MAALLEGPGVPVRVGEIGEAGVVPVPGIHSRAESAGPGLDRVLVPDRAHRHAVGDEPCPLGLEVGGDESGITDPVR